MNISVITLTTLIICNYYNTEVFCIPIAQPQVTRPQSSNDGFGTALSADRSPADNDDDCIEAAINSGFAANGHVGVAFNLVGLNTGGISCKQLLNTQQGKKRSFILFQPFYGNRSCSNPCAKSDY